ncbi:MAG: BatD family protein [Gammaproteobacteria bacterium]
MKRLLLLLLGVISLSANAEVRVEAYAQPEGDVYLGQRVRLMVDVRTDARFTTAPRYPELKLAGVVALLPEALGVSYTDRSEDATWIGHRQRYVLFPQRVGALTIPPIELPLAVAVEGQEKGEARVVKTPAVTINVVAPPGAADVSAFVTTPLLTVSDNWDRDLGELKVGDAITRTITQRAEDVFALVMPSVEFGDIEGLGVYPATPDLDDRAQRGQYSATRVDRVTYVLQSEGEFTIPAVEVSWFNPQRRRMMTETLEAVTIEVAPNPDAVIGDTDSSDTESVFEIEALVRAALDWLANNIHWLTLVAGTLFALHRLWRRFMPGLIRGFREARERYRHSESRYFRDTQRALRSGNVDRFIRSFWRWADRLPGRRPPLSLSVLRDVASETGMAATWTETEAARYRGGKTGTTTPFRLRDLRHLRRAYLCGQTDAGRPGASLHKLNP